MNNRMDLVRFAYAELLFALLLCVPLFAQSQTYPTKAVNVYIGFAAGATTDLSARALGQGLERCWASRSLWKPRPVRQPRSQPGWWRANRMGGAWWSKKVSGWMGKHWACHQLAEAASGELM